MSLARTALAPETIIRVKVGAIGLARLQEDDVSFYASYAVTADSVGDWDGAEALAAAQVNRIYLAIQESLSPSVEPQLAHNIFRRVWEDWGYDMRLLDITEVEIRHYIVTLLRTAA